MGTGQFSWEWAVPGTGMQAGHCLIAVIALEFWQRGRLTFTKHEDFCKIRISREKRGKLSGMLAAG